MKKFKKQNGQVMILSVVILGGILLSAAAIAGLLMVYQIRASNDAVNSAKAIFAADAGIEVVSWCFFKGCPPYDAQNPPPIDFDDGGVSFEVDSTITATDITIVSKGLAAGGKVIRILETVFVVE
jgi:hypothetical protein